MIADKLREKHWVALREHRRNPRVIIMHPVMFEDFVREVRVATAGAQFGEDGSLKSYRGIEIIRSTDLKESEIRVY